MYPYHVGISLMSLSHLCFGCDSGDCWAVPCLRIWSLLKSACSSVTSVLSWTSEKWVNSPATPETMRNYNFMPSLAHNLPSILWGRDGCWMTVWGCLRLSSTDTLQGLFFCSWTDNWNVEILIPPWVLQVHSAKPCGS